MSTLTKYQTEALRYDRHISLTANAGSGKTTVLAKRFVEILLNENVTLNNIVAITFTEKAASELYTKIAKELDAKLSESIGVQKNKLESLRRNLVSAKISTIHSFCIDVLKDYAPEAGIDASFSPIDARLANELLEQSIDELLNKRIREDSKEIKNLIRIFGNKSTLISKVKLLFNKRKSTQKLDEDIYRKPTNEIALWFKSNFENKIELVFHQLIIDLIREVSELNIIASNFKATEVSIEINRLTNEINSKKELVEKLILLLELGNELLKKDGRVKQQKYVNAAIYSENESLIESINEKFSELKRIDISHNYEELNVELAQFGKSLINFYRDVNEKYTTKKQQSSFLDFEDLLLLTYKLLQNKDLANQLSQKYKYLMVDEFQDTNEIQYEIFMPILQYLSTGNLFVVGDSKQSIYMFREAEVKVFNDTKELIGNREGEKSLLQLPHSFRLAPNIAFFTNKLFGKLFANPNTFFNEVEYNDLVCAYLKENEGEIEILVSEEEEGTSEVALVVRKIIQMVNRSENKKSFSDITILCRVRKNFTELENEFTKYNIPYSIVGGKGFYQQQLVLDVYSYLSFLINNKNDLALVSILRSPYYGISDVELTEISLCVGKSFFDKFKSYSNENSNYKNTTNQLNAHIILATKTDVSTLLRRIHNETSYWSYIANKHDGKQEIANLEKLIQKAIHFNEQGYSTLYDFTNYLKDAINNLEDEGHAESDKTENTIKIMTIHQAKGLEFKVVILYKTNHKNFDETIKTKDISVDKDFGILAKLPNKNNYFEDFKQAPIVGLFNYFQNKKSIAELKRLLYVAITRAEEQLIISMQLKKGKLQNDSFASMIIESLNINLSESVNMLKGDLIYMKYVDGNYQTIKKEIASEINICNSIELDETFQNSNQKEAVKDYEILIDKIPGSEKNEIISASKISLFLQCPRKYQLTYEFGYGELTKLFKEQNDFEFNAKEEEENIPGNILGRIVHAVLEQVVDENELENCVHKLVYVDDEILTLSDLRKKNLELEVFHLIETFYKSKSFEELKPYKNYYNEFEIYKRENDYYLYGIIDRLVFEKDKIIIVDYKTDRINEKNVDEKVNTYLNQLKFYAYILISKFKFVTTIKLNLVFIRDDSFSISQKIDIKEIMEFGEIIKDSVLKIRSKQFEIDAPGCKDMKYYLLDECNN